MLSKRSMILVLIAINAVLLLAVTTRVGRSTAAFAQGGARAGDFLCVTAKVAGQSYDMLYTLDVPQRKLFGFYPATGGATRLAATQPRDLAKDFNRP